MTDLSAARRAAWETRRAKYGVCGHRGVGAAYRRNMNTITGRALRLIARLHSEGTLSEGQCCRELEMDRVEFRTMCDREFPQ